MGHNSPIAGFDRALRLAAPLVCALGLAGCGGIEFQGKVFDYMGLSGDRKAADPQMTERPPLLVPPSVSSLPPPSDGVSVATARPDWPQNPEKVRKDVVAAKEAKQGELEAKNDPLNPYAGKKTLLDKLLLRKKTQEEPVADVPEPDPSDKPSQEKTASGPPKGITPHVSEAPLPKSDLTPTTPDSYGRMSDPANANQSNTLY